MDRFEETLPTSNSDKVNLEKRKRLIFVAVFGLFFLIGGVLLARLLMGDELGSYKSKAFEGIGVGVMAITATDDAYVKDSKPEKNYGSANHLRTRNKHNEVYISYLKFDLSGISRPVSSANLELFVYNGTDSPLNLVLADNKLIDGLDWSENIITWKNRPIPLRQMGVSKAPIENDQLVVFDVTNEINSASSNQITFMLTSNTSNSAYLYSKEGQSGANRLTINASSGGTPWPTMRPIPTATPALVSPTSRPLISVTPPALFTPSIAPTYPPLGDSGSLWITRSRLMSLPMSGVAWNNVVANANGDWGAPCLDDNNCEHDVKTLAGAFFAARTGDQAMTTKTIQALNLAINTSSKTSRALELCRGIQSYVVAADVLGYRSATFEQALRHLINLPVSGHSGGDGAIGTAERSGNNWGDHCRASVIASAYYLKDSALMAKMVAAQKDFIGVQKALINYTDTNWHANPSNKAGVNRVGAKISSTFVGGVLTEDWRRGGEYKWPPSKSGYMWEGMQGFVVAAVMLQNINQLPITAGDNAMLRAMQMLYGQGEGSGNNPVFQNPAESEDSFIPWVVNYYTGSSFPTQSPTSPGKGMAYTDWTHMR